MIAACYSCSTVTSLLTMKSSDSSPLQSYWPTSCHGTGDSFKAVGNQLYPWLTSHKRLLCCIHLKRALAKDEEILKQCSAFLLLLSLQFSNFFPKFTLFGFWKDYYALWTRFCSRALARTICLGTPSCRPHRFRVVADDFMSSIQKMPKAGSHSSVTCLALLFVLDVRLGQW